LLFHPLIALCILTGLISVITFVLYVQARMWEQEQKEKLFQSMHFISLLVFVFLGVIILVMLSNMNL
jgi:hypothetical protein